MEKDKLSAFSIAGTIFVCLIAGGIDMLYAQTKKHPEGSVNKTVKEPGGKGSAEIKGNRSVEGNTASSNVSITGSGGKSASASGSSEIHENTATGKGTITGQRGQTTTMSGSATKEGNAVNASGTATGPQGQTVSGTTEVSKAGDTVSATATISGPQGQEVTVSGSGSKEEGSVTVETRNGTSSTTWNQNSSTVTGTKGRSKTFNRH